MPHLTIEYSGNVAEHHDIDDLVAGVHEAALASGVAAVDALRTRAAPRLHYRVADGDPRFGFVAIWARMAPGRTDEEKRRFLDGVLGAARARIGDGPLVIAWSAAIDEIDTDARINHNEIRSHRAGDGAPADRSTTSRQDS